jgi:hypothetical protein
VILEREARRYLDLKRAGGATPDARDIFDARLAERLGDWSVRWMEAGRNVGTRAARFDAPRAHLDRMRSLENGRSVKDALKEAGLPDDKSIDVATLREFAEVAKFFRLEAEAQLQDMKAR